MNNPITENLPADLPEDWSLDDTLAPDGTYVGLTEQHGYNYLGKQVNATQRASKQLGEALAAAKASDFDAIPSTEKGQANGVAELDSSGKVPAAQLPAMDYDPAGSADAVQQALNTHTSNKQNPHGVTATQVGAYTKEQTLQSATAGLFGLSGSATPDDVLQKLSKAAFNANGSITDVNGNAIGVQIATGSYVGTGKYGESNPTVIDLPFTAKLFMVSGSQSSSPVIAWINGMNKLRDLVDGHGVELVTSGNRLSFYSNDANNQVNESGQTYFWIAFR